MLNLKLLQQIVSEASMYAEIQQEPAARIFNYRYFDLQEYIELAQKYGERVVREIRGITVIGDSEIYPSISKFFNLNEHEYAIKTEDLPAEVLLVEKLDGSLISPVVLPNGKLHLKSKGSLYSEQARAANELLQTKYADIKLADKILDYIARGIYLQFEYIAPTNRIVVPYETDELVLIAVRAKNPDGTFDYLPPEDLPLIAKDLGIRCAYLQKVSKDQLLKWQKELTGIEGWVVYIDRRLVKIKTDWYLQQHRLVNSVTNEKFIFDMVLSEQLDDVIAAIEDEQLKRAVIEYAHKIYQYLNKFADELLNYYKEWKQLGSKDFALKYKGSEVPKYIGLFRRYENNFLQQVDKIVKELAQKKFSKYSQIVNAFGKLQR